MEVVRVREDGEELLGEVQRCKHLVLCRAMSRGSRGQEFSVGMQVVPDRGVFGFELKAVWDRDLVGVELEVVWGQGLFGFELEVVSDQDIFGAGLEVVRGQEDEEERLGGFR